MFKIGDKVAVYSCWPEGAETDDMRLVIPVGQPITYTFDITKPQRRIGTIQGFSQFYDNILHIHFDGFGEKGYLQAIHEKQCRKIVKRKDK